MPSWLLLVFVFLVWCLWLLASVLQRAVKDARAGLPKNQRGGVRIFPAIPVFPLVFWGLALLVDRAANPMGSLIVGLFHLVFAVFLAGYIVRDWWRLRSIDRAA